MGYSQTRIKRFRDMMAEIFSIVDEDITCGQCFEHIDVYVDKLRSGEEPEHVLPEVKTHLAQCDCCREEFEAMITILEAHTGAN